MSNTSVLSSSAPRARASAPSHRRHRMGLHACAAAKRSESSDSASIQNILSAVALGRLDIEDAARNIEEISCGLHALRKPSPSLHVLEAPGMPAAQLAASLQTDALEQHTAVARTVPSELYAMVRNLLPGVQYHAGAQMLLFSDPGASVPKPARLPGHVAIVCGSALDMQMAYEAKVALDLMGGYATLVRGISAADLVGLVQARERIRAADAVIVCCAEQPSLAGLVAGMVDVPVVALPGMGQTDPTLALPAPGVANVAPGDGVSAAAAAARTLHVAAQYIQFRKDREAVPARDEEKIDTCMDLSPPPMSAGGTVMLRHDAKSNGAAMAGAASQ